MVRRGDGIYLRGKTWNLDFVYQGSRHIAKLGKNIPRNVTREIAIVERAAILKGKEGISAKAPADLPLDKAVNLFLERHGSS